MDTLTHIALGAIVGEAIGGKKLGKKALIIGAVTQCLPDSDILAALWLSPSVNILVHRGLTHSFLFILLITPALAWLAKWWNNSDSLSLIDWIYFFGIQLSIHLILDSFNAYGTGWLEPFSDKRFSFHLLFVADIFFTLPLVLASGALIFLKSTSRVRMGWVRFGLIASTLYIGYTFNNKVSIEHDVDETYARLNIAPTKNFVTPTPFNNLLWYAIAEVDSGYYASYHSVFDDRSSDSVVFFYRNEQLLEQVNNSEEVQQLLRFSRGYYTVEQQGDTLVFNALSFGQIAGWSNPKAKFSFQYYLQPALDNKFVVQRGRLSNWNLKTTQLLLKRIEGN